MLEATTDKERILALYLNIIEWGEGLFGAEAAAQYYYKKSAAQLTQQEAALLASMPTRPVYYQQHLDNKRLKNKTKIIQKRMKNATLPQGDDWFSGSLKAILLPHGLETAHAVSLNFKTFLKIQIDSDCYDFFN